MRYTVCRIWYDKTLFLNLVKSEQIVIIRELLWIQNILKEWQPVLGNRDEILDDQGRYTKMGMKLEPNDPIFLIRNENAE